jgi:hypothetical protein
MQVRKQFTVFLENKPGRLATVLSTLADAKINLIALSVMDRTEHSVLRFVAEQSDGCGKALQGLNVQFAQAEVLEVDLRNQPGALAHVCETLAGEHVNIDYAYCSSGGRNGRVVGIFKVSNLEKAQRLLGEPANGRRTDRRSLRDQRSYRRV